MPSSTATQEQKDRWAVNKKKATHLSNVEKITYEFPLTGIDIDDIGNIDELIKMLKRLARIRKREDRLKEQRVLPKISEKEWKQFNQWCGITLRPIFIGHALEYPNPTNPEEVATEVIEIAKKYEMVSWFADEFPEEARARVIELYGEVCKTAKGNDAEPEEKSEEPGEA